MMRQAARRFAEMSKGCARSSGGRTINTTTSNDSGSSGSSAALLVSDQKRCFFTATKAALAPKKKNRVKIVIKNTNTKDNATETKRAVPNTSTEWKYDAILSEQIAAQQDKEVAKPPPPPPHLALADPYLTEPYPKGAHGQGTNALRRMYTNTRYYTEYKPCLLACAAEHAWIGTAISRSQREAVANARALLDVHRQRLKVEARRRLGLPVDPSSAATSTSVSPSSTLSRQSESSSPAAAAAVGPTTNVLLEIMQLEKATEKALANAKRLRALRRGVRRCQADFRAVYRETLQKQKKMKVEKKKAVDDEAAAMVARRRQQIAAGEGLSSQSRIRAAVHELRSMPNVNIAKTRNE